MILRILILIIIRDARPKDPFAFAGYHAFDHNGMVHAL